tara:strand:+ start:158 stop:379 length:222 start_codon:yes stop_codon:yes gene_type:complete
MDDNVALKIPRTEDPAQASGKGICLKPWGKICERVCSVIAFCKNLISMPLERTWLETFFLTMSTSLNQIKLRK